MKKKLLSFVILVFMLASLCVVFSACTSEEGSVFLPPQEIWVEEGVLYWEDISGVDQYILNINGTDVTVKNNFYDEIEAGVEYTVSVKASKIWGISDWSESFTFTTLSAPERIQYIGEVLFWTAVPDATGYIVQVNDYEYYHDTNMIESYVFATANTQSIRVKAVGDGETNFDSAYSYTFEFYIIPRYLDDMETIVPTGSGSTYDPYIISTVNNFKWLMDESANGESFNGKSFLQTADIDFRYYVDYIPIGLSSAFEGTYDGGGYGMYNLSYVGQLSGIFGVVGSSGTVKNLNKYSGEIEGRVSGGGIVAINNGQIMNCSNSGVVIGNSCGGIVGQNNNTGSVLSSSNYSAVVGDTSGGIVGWNLDGIILSCKNYASVESTSVAGGICGNNGGYISLCQNFGAVKSKVVGGIVGENYGDVAYNSNDATISGSMYAGGICGENLENISYSYTRGEVVITSSTSSSCAGGLVGRNAEGIVKFCFALGSVSADSGSVGSVVGYYRIGLLENIYVVSSSLDYIGNEEVYVGEIIDFTLDLHSQDYISEINAEIKEWDEAVYVSVFKFDEVLKLYFE